MCQPPWRRLCNSLSTVSASYGMSGDTENANARHDMTAQRLSLRERNKIRTRNDLLSGILDLFAEGGLAACSVEAAAGLAGTSKSTAYSYFPDGIDGMFRELYHQIAQDVMDRGKALRDAEKLPADRIAGLVKGLLTVCSDPRIGGFYMMLSPALSPLLAPAFGGASRAYRKMVQEDLEVAGLDPEEADLRALFIIGALRETGRQVALAPEMLETLSAALTRFISLTISR